MNHLFTITTATYSAAPKWLENGNFYKIKPYLPYFYIFIRMEIITQIVAEYIFFDTS